MRKICCLTISNYRQPNAEFYHTDRGGDITYHGPGQLVGYPIFNLDAFGMGVKKYIYTIEEAVIDMLCDFGITSSRLEGATGVWLDADIPGKTRKICAIGVKINRSVSMHGFALNINTDLTYFNHINPCGFTDKSVTSMEKETGQKHNFEHIKAKLLHYFEKHLGFTV
jgi:lipoyl(octanoyl) transferase